MTAIEAFLEQKNLSTNSRQAYAYDLEQFRQIVDGEIADIPLQRYQSYLDRLKPSVQKRKRSAVNQFLAYLYETDQLKQFYRLKPSSPPLRELKSEKGEVPLLDRQVLEGPAQSQTGQLIALLIYHLGLQPSELRTLPTRAIDLNFGVVTVERSRQIRVLRLPEHLHAYLEPQLTGVYLFGKKDKPYTRQWLFQSLQNFLTEVGLPDWNAQKLREQYIMHQLNAGVSLPDIAQQLGLKTIVTLEKYAQRQ